MAKKKRSKKLAAWEMSITITNDMIENAAKDWDCEITGYNKLRVVLSRRLREATPAFVTEILGDIINEGDQGIRYKDAGF